MELISLAVHNSPGINKPKGLILQDLTLIYDAVINKNKDCESNQKKQHDLCCHHSRFHKSLFFIFRHEHSPPDVR